MATQFLGSRSEGESQIEQIQREAQWKQDHACYICGRFECDGDCESEYGSDYPAEYDNEETDNMPDHEWCDGCGRLVHKEWIVEDCICQECFNEREIEIDEDDGEFEYVDNAHGEVI